MTPLDAACALRPRLVTFAQRLAGDAWLAEDAVHDVLLRVIVNPDLLPEASAEVETFLRTAVRRRLIDLHRRGRLLSFRPFPPEWLGLHDGGFEQTPLALVDERDPETVVLDALLRLADAATVETVLARLCPAHRAALLARYWAEEAPVGSQAKSVVHRARQAFRREWEQERVA